MYAREQSHGDLEDTTLLVTVCNVTATNAEDTSNHVRWDRHELSHIVLVAKSLDNGWQEQRDGVEWSEDADSDDAIYPYFPVSEGIASVLHGEFVCEGPAIRLQATGDLFFLQFAKKFGSVRVVVHGAEGDAS
jgi:hypothetical protein